MKGILLSVLIAGAAVALLIYYADEVSKPKLSGADDIEDAAEDAYDTMNAGIGHVERTTEKAIRNAFQ